MNLSAEQGRRALQRLEDRVENAHRKPSPSGEEAAARPLRLATCSLLLLLAIDAALVSSPTVPRFEYVPLNYLAFVLLCAVTSIAFWAVVLFVRTWWARAGLGLIAIAVSLPLCLLTLFASLFMGEVLVKGVDLSFQRIGEVSAGRSVYRVYRTDGGAMTAWGIVLRRETPLVPGVKLVTRLCSAYPAHDARIEMLPGGYGRLHVAALDDAGPETVCDFSM